MLSMIMKDPISFCCGFEMIFDLIWSFVENVQYVYQRKRLLNDESRAQTHVPNTRQFPVGNA